MNIFKTLIGGAACVAVAASLTPGQAVADNVAEEVVWMVGDRPIWKSEVEEAYTQMLEENFPIQGDPYCFVPEQLAIQRLYLHQADVDTLEATPSLIQADVESQITDWTLQAGSKEKLEEMIHKTIPEIRTWLTEMRTNSSRVEMVQRKLTENVKSTPAAVRRYYNSLAPDSMPFVPMQVEVQILTLNPTIPASEIDDIKDRLRSYAERVNSGETTFNTLAVLYSEDASTATNGGELGFRSRSNLQALMPEYADVAFNLSEPGKVSRVFKTDNGYHIVQLIERRGDRINTRHIMLRPHVSDEALNSARERLDSIRADMLNNLFTFEEATALISQDKDTRNNRGVMVNSNTSSTLFEMGDLPQEVAKQVALMLPGQISQAFTMVDSKTNQEIVAIVKLTARHEAHRANVTDDYEVIQNMYENAERQRILNEWIDKKIAETYIRIEPAWRNCSSFRHNWLKESK